jgi:hypothetical protein
LRIQQKHFWKYIPKGNQSVTQTEVGDKIIKEPRHNVENFADNIPPIFNFYSSVNTLNNFDIPCSDYLIFLISVIQVLCELLITSIQWNASDQMEFLIL